MRKEPYIVDSYVHVVKRGSRGLPIVKDDRDRLRFLLILRHLNDTFQPEHWFREISANGFGNIFERPKEWPVQNKLVKILAFCLVENHFHLLLKEITDGGISQFMKRLGTAMAKNYNEKYKTSGTIFQGSFKSKTVNSDDYLRYVSAYIQVKNCFELYPLGGYNAAVNNFDKAFEWAKGYNYSSLGDFLKTNNHMFIEPEILSEIFTDDQFVDFSRDMILGRQKESSDFILE